MDNTEKILLSMPQHPLEDQGYLTTTVELCPTS